MKIIYVIHQFLPSAFAGTEMYAHDLAKEMSRRGNYVCLVSMSHRHDYKFTRYTHKEPYDLIKIKNKRNHLKEFKDILKDIKPDIVHFQHLQYFSPRIIEITKSLDIPMILHLHDYFYICKRIRLLTRYGKVCRASTNCRGCKDWRAVWKSHIESVDLILANSHFTRDAYIKNGFNPERIIVNYCGIDINRVSKIKHSKSDVLRFAFLGRVIKEKGVEVLIDAFNRLDNSVSLEIWGRVGAYKFDLLQRIKNQNIEIKGEYGLSNIKDVLSGADIVVIPSIWLEPWSIVKSEALAAGLGVLASAIGGIPEGLCGDRVLFFKPNSVTSLLKAIKSVCANNFFWKVKKNNGYRAKTIKEDAWGLEYIYSRYARKEKKYIVNSKVIYWPYMEGGIEIQQLKGNNEWRAVYMLKDVGARFWELLSQFKPLEEIVNKIAMEYDVCKEEVERDINSLINRLRKKGIIIEA